MSIAHFQLTEQVCLNVWSPVLGSTDYTVEICEIDSLGMTQLLTKQVCLNVQSPILGNTVTHC